jgi:hypothetical protein
VKVLLTVEMLWPGTASAPELRRQSSQSPCSCASTEANTAMSTKRRNADFAHDPFVEGAYRRMIKAWLVGLICPGAEVRD